MPLLSEPTAKERKRSRGWLWLLAAVPMLLVLFLVATTFRPLMAEAGGLVVSMGGEWSDNPEGRSGFRGQEVAT